VQKGVIGAGSDIADFDLATVGHYTFVASDDEPSVLLGRMFQNDTSTFEISDALSLAVVFDEDSQTAGQFQTGGDPDGDDAAETTTLFPFALSTVPDMLGVALSTGEWHGEDGGRYVLQLTGNELFSITVVPASQKADTVVFVAKKIPIITEQTFFQKYKTFFFMGVFVIFNTWLKKKTAAWTAPAEAATADAAAVTDATAKKTE
jgi:hypothetical protein